ncbi:uncharacterized protein [Medicago truncatula]|uniref:uncharacterized protein n=1 Tax=Medicago truncatula TaxID=3880 RepID=UPI00196717D8|nr:uncharacterized protein LOC120577580 [Medicago truncatula]
MLVDREGLWYRVLVARYGEEGGVLKDGGRRASGWWRDLQRVRDGGGGVDGEWFSSCVSKVLGNGGNSTVDEASNLVWHKNVPLKVSILAWRLLRNRLPTKINLAVRGIMVQDAHLCVSGCGMVETVQHLFVSCPIFRNLWQYVRAWIGVSGVDPFDVVDHFVQFSYLLGHAAKKRSFMQLLWLACVWVLWTERNNRQFNNTENTIYQLFVQVQNHSFWWLKAANVVHELGVHNWFACPLPCLGIG